MEIKKTYSVNGLDFPSKREAAAYERKLKLAQEIAVIVKAEPATVMLLLDSPDFKVARKRAA